VKDAQAKENAKKELAQEKNQLDMQKQQSKPEETARRSIRLNLKLLSSLKDNYYICILKIISPNEC
jgi:hypothetical protein